MTSVDQYHQSCAIKKCGIFEYVLHHNSSIVRYGVLQILPLFSCMDPENIGRTLGISLVSIVQAELHVFQVLRPPSWISHFRFGDT